MRELFNANSRKLMRITISCLCRHSREDLQGIKFGDELRRIGFLGETEASHEANPLSAHFEVHIEQGPVLQAEGCPVAVVTGVQGAQLAELFPRGIINTVYE